jgi:hypothetical protein
MVLKHLAEMARSITLKKCNQGEIIFSAGDLYPKEYYIILLGKVALYEPIQRKAAE